ncbi:tRNA synthetases class I (C) catalytic domain-containing protein [Roridomyces roridus]|uniref:cysteine--tRNA ligase n=1 Tax=Roridomyces roridus TaxID=1738132 RepID=A0AAD7CE11_9AGAR|nr:tRNA synthetases class I (C) catalytic domain-containing protein [Roridomyces roridus]
MILTRSASGLSSLHPLSATRHLTRSALMSVQQPTWTPPQRQREEPVLKIYNSLTKSKTEFIPSDGRRVKWYNCGPTVYDSSHMGHARNYVTQDILRRIMTDYFGYDVHFVMNITDIDDKIIKRARQNHLLDQFREETKSVSPELITRVHAAWRIHVREQLRKGLPAGHAPNEGEEDAFWPSLTESIQNKDWKQECLRRDEKFDMHFSSASQTLAALEVARAQLSTGNHSQEAAHKLISDSKDILSQALDDQYKSTVTDPNIARSLAAYWEGQFFSDMARLKVRDPDTVTRVTEYVPEIVSFVEGIVKNGFAYESEGSVYFDTEAFDKSPKHDYAKLEPWSKGNRELLEDGEGALAQKGGARRPADFALWKASRPGEPSWPSPWGAGRPGWHIECSVMASAILGDNMDIHSGGIDLAFPHHDNEMAQSEAYHECGAWVNYFIHTGHLHIEGLKMSKSLKNFITIDEILQKYSARQLRLAFLSQLWNAKVDFTESMMTGEVRALETTINNFFTNVSALLSQAKADGSDSNGHHNYEEPERDLRTLLYESQYAFRAALCDSFNTPAALGVLRDLITRTNVYITSRGSKALNIQLLENVARWSGSMLRMFGLGSGPTEELGWGVDGDDAAGGSAINREEALMPYIRALSTFRDSVRRLAVGKGETALTDILALCDRLRDVDLVPLGVALDDQEDGKALVKLVPPAELLRAREEKRAAAEAKVAKKAAAAEAERAKRAAKLEKGRLAPQEMYKPPNVPEGTYGSWDEDGKPLTDSEGKELGKNQKKKVEKEWSTQKKLHEEWVKEMSQ